MILKIMGYYRKTNIGKAFYSLSMSQCISRRLTELTLEYVRFDEIRSLEFSKTLKNFVHLRCLSFTACDFDGLASQAIKQLFLVNNVSWRILHLRPFEQLMLAIVESPSSRKLERIRYFLLVGHSDRMGKQQRRIIRHVLASLEKCSAATTSSFSLATFPEVLSWVQLLGILLGNFTLKVQPFE